jgi:hypothetical protein
VQARREFRPRQLHLSLRAFPLVLAMMATLSALGFSDDPGCARARFQESDVSALRRHVSDVIAFTHRRPSLNLTARDLRRSGMKTK